MDKFIVVSLGMGTNSIAILVGMKERGIRPDIILFADTGAERPHTYAMIPVMNEWLEANDFPPIVTVRVTGELIEENCIRRNALPSVAYGRKSCSQRWKTEPQEKYLNSNEAAKAHLAKGLKITKIIGIDLGEEHRAGQPNEKQAKKYVNEFPLIEWEWGRDECIQAIAKAGIPLPGKSSCFFCPNMRQTEIRELADLNPELCDRAIAMEDNAKLTHIKGLGRNWRWRDLIATDDMFGFSDPVDTCMSCYDGSR